MDSITSHPWPPRSTAWIHLTALHKLIRQRQLYSLLRNYGLPWSPHPHHEKNDTSLRQGLKCQDRSSGSDGMTRGPRGIYKLLTFFCCIEPTGPTLLNLKCSSLFAPLCLHSLLRPLRKLLRLSTKQIRSRREIIFTSGVPRHKKRSFLVPWDVSVPSMSSAKAYILMWTRGLEWHCRCRKVSNFLALYGSFVLMEVSIWSRIAQVKQNTNPETNQIYKDHFGTITSSRVNKVEANIEKTKWISELSRLAQTLILISDAQATLVWLWL